MSVGTNGFCDAFEFIEVGRAFHEKEISSRLNHAGISGAIGRFGVTLGRRLK